MCLKDFNNPIQNYLKMGKRFKDWVVNWAKRVLSCFIAIGLDRLVVMRYWNQF